MLSALGAIGSIFSFLGAALKAVIGLLIYRAGKDAQQNTDLKATVSTLGNEAKAAAAAPHDKQSALKRLEDGSA